MEQRLLLRFTELEHRLTVRFASVMVVLMGLLFAATFRRHIEGHWTRLVCGTDWLMENTPLPPGRAVAAGGLRVLFSAAEIAARVDALAAEIARTIPGDFVVVGLLKGAALFIADLVRALHRAGAQPEIEFMRLSSYGLGKESSGQVQVLGQVPSGLAGRRVLLVDDIVDTGRSLAAAAALLRQHGTAAPWTCALLDKPRRREIEVAIDFVGFSVGDVFVAGYGTDYGERYRHLPYIGIVE